MSELKPHQDLTIESLEAICKRLDKSYGPISGLDQFKLIDDILRLIKYRDSRQESETKAQAVEEAAKAMQHEYDNCGDENLMRSQNLYYSALRYGANWLDRYAQQLRDSN